MELNYKVFGEGEPVIIIHGLFGTLDNWQSIAKKLSANFMVFIIDLRNHGRSPHADEFSYKIMADDVQAFMENNWIYEAAVVGHSMGGKVAMQLAGDNPDMVRELVLVDMAPKSYEGSHQAIFEAMFELDLDTLKSRKEADQQMSAKVPSFGVRQFLIKNLSLNKATQQYEWKHNLPVIYEHYNHILQYTPMNDPYEGPTLFIKGANSDYILTEELEQYQELFPTARIETILNAGHWVHAEQPARFLEVLTAFLKEE
ncbi:MAG: alpha/beta fold hydrolase [Aureispira sp.]